MVHEETRASFFDTESSEALTRPMRSLVKRVSDIIPSLWRNNSQSPRRRRTFHRDVEQEDFQCASARCLSSYYSVFVARLAIMVC